MTINPHNSPWLKPKFLYVKNNILRSKYSAIKNHCTTTLEFIEYDGILRINKNIYIAKNSIKFRLKSHLDWAWYTPKTLAHAIDTNTVDSYYEVMLNSINSDPNIWKDTDFEMELKSFYAARAGRANMI